MGISDHGAGAQHLSSWLDIVAREHAERTAVIARGMSWSYAELHRQSLAWSHWLQRRGVGRSTCTGLLMPNSPQWLACAFGVWRNRGILVPINTLYRSKELEHALRKSDVEILLSVRSFLQHDYVRELRAISPSLGQAGDTRCTELPALRHLTLLEAEGEIHGAERTTDDPTAAEGDADAAIFFTSGSTAAPKGVVHTHASMLAAAANVSARLGLDASDRVFGYLPFFFNGGLVGVALAAMQRGGAVLLQEVFDAESAIEMMIEHGCSTFFGWPHQADALLRHPQFDRRRLRLRKGPGATAPWARSLLADDHQCVGAWGMSETGPMACCSSHDDPLEVRSSSHGRPMPGLELRIVTEDNRPVPAGHQGEIAVRGTSMMRAYYGETEETCFDAEGFFHTGDRAYVDERGNLHFVGRMRDVIKTAGVSVSVAEVEDALLTHAGVALAHVVPVAHETRGENIAAFVVTREASLGAEAIQEHCRRHLASYKVPRHVFLVREDELPVLGSGKIDRTALRERARALVGEGSTDR